MGTCLPHRPPERGWPAIIQGGMGVAISNWRLARAVSEAGELGVVSGTGIDTVLVRRLQDGDPGGHMQRALHASPWPKIADILLTKYYLPNGRKPGQPYARLPMWTERTPAPRQAVAMMAAFAEVWLAKEGHEGLVGLNLLTKVALPNLPVLYGAIHAGVDVVLMGAGIPRDIPGALDRLARHEPAALPIEVLQSRADDPPVFAHFDPGAYGSGLNVPLRRPAFFPIIAANSLAVLMTRKASGSIEGFVVEGPTAGGHNAPPRGPKRFDELGQPIYGERDVVDLEAIAALGYPFWLAGGEGTPERLKAAQAAGARGIQVGTLFAYSEESGMAPELKAQAIAAVKRGQAEVRTDPLASPTGFPFKVLELEGTLSAATEYEARQRICDLGYLRDAYRTETGAIRFRCASEPVADYVRKGGQASDASGRKCLCNGLMATAGLPQVQKNGDVEGAIVTSGDAINGIRALLAEASGDSYRAVDVLRYLSGS